MSLCNRLRCQSETNPECSALGSQEACLGVSVESHAQVKSKCMGSTSDWLQIKADAPLVETSPGS